MCMLFFSRYSLFLVLNLFKYKSAEEKQKDLLFVKFVCLAVKEKHKFIK